MPLAHLHIVIPREGEYPPKKFPIFSELSISLASHKSYENTERRHCLTNFGGRWAMCPDSTGQTSSLWQHTISVTSFNAFRQSQCLKPTFPVLAAQAEPQSPPSDLATRRIGAVVSAERQNALPAFCVSPDHVAVSCNRSATVAVGGSTAFPSTLAVADASALNFRAKAYLATNGHKAADHDDWKSSTAPQLRLHVTVCWSLSTLPNRR